MHDLDDNLNKAEIFVDQSIGNHDGQGLTGESVNRIIEEEGRVQYLKRKFA